MDKASDKQVIYLNDLITKAVEFTEKDPFFSPAEKTKIHATLQNVTPENLAKSEASDLITSLKAGRVDLQDGLKIDYRYEAQALLDRVQSLVSENSTEWEAGEALPPRAFTRVQSRHKSFLRRPMIASYEKMYYTAHQIKITMYMNKYDLSYEKAEKELWIW